MRLVSRTAGTRFPKSSRTRKSRSKISFGLQGCFVHIFEIQTELLFIHNYTLLCLEILINLKWLFGPENDSGVFEKRAPEEAEIG